MNWAKGKEKEMAVGHESLEKGQLQLKAKDSIHFIYISAGKCTVL